MLWSARYDSGNGDDEAWDIAVDGSGNAYVTGRSKRSGGSQFDYVTIKYASSDGSQVWLSRLNGAGDGDDEAKAIGLDSSRNVFVTGWSKNASGNWDYWTVKLNGNDQGQTLWTRVYDFANLDDRAHDLAVRHDGHVVVTGASSWLRDPIPPEQDPVVDSDYATLWYDRDDGSDLHPEQRFSGAHLDILDEAKAVSIDVYDNAYITGILNGSNATSKRCGTVKYDKNGNRCWYNVFIGSGWSEAAGLDIAVSPSKHYVAVTGFGNPASEGEGKTRDYLTLLFETRNGLSCDDSQRSPLWHRLYHFDERDEAAAVGVDSGDNVYVTGRSRNEPHDPPNPGAFAYATVKYTSAGDRCWVIRYDNGTQSGDDSANSIAVTPDGIILVTGESTGTNLDYATMRHCQLVGDVDRDGDVDYDDLELLMDCFGQTCTCCATDLNGDGVVDDIDIAILLTNIGMKCS